MKQSLQALEYFFPPDFVASLTEESFLYRLLGEQRPEVEIWRQHMNDSLDLARRYDLADADLEARLRKGDWESFQAAINELKSAKFLEGLFGINSLRWHPQGRKGKLGEFEIPLGNLDEPIFVEVKTIFPRELERLEERIIEKLRHYTRQVMLPFALSVYIKEAGKAEDFSGKKFKEFLWRELSQVNIEALKGEPLKLSDYRDHKTGLHLEVEVLHISPKRAQKSCYIGIIGGMAKVVRGKDYIRHSLDRAYEQLPKGQQACLVILCSSTQFPMDEDDVLDALLGTLAVRVTTFKNGSIESEPFRQPNGFPHPERNRQLSAVGLYREKFAEKGIESGLEIYHNPWARNPLDYSIFEGKGVRQLIKVNNQEMGWRE